MSWEKSQRLEWSCMWELSITWSRSKVLQPLSSSQEHRRAGSLFHALWIKSWSQWPYWEPCYWVRCSQDLTLCDCMPSKIGDTLKTLSSLLPRIPCKDFVLLYSQHIFPICIFVWLLRFPNLKVLHHFVCVSVSSVHVCVFSESILSVSAKDFVNKCENYKQDKKYFRK